MLVSGVPVVDKIVVSKNAKLFVFQWIKCALCYRAVSYNTNNKMGVAFCVYFMLLGTSGPRQNDRHFADWKLLNVNDIPLEFLPYCLIDNMAALVQIMAWLRSGDKPLYEAKMVWFTDACMGRSASMVQLWFLTIHDASLSRNNKNVNICLYFSKISSAYKVLNGYTVALWLPITHPNPP